MNPQDYIDLRTIDLKRRLTPRRIRTVIGVLLGLLLLYGSWFQVGAESVGVVLRFGKYVRETGPGLHFKLPLGVEAVYKVPAQRQMKEEFGFRTQLAGIQTSYSPQQFPEESLMLTGDLNVLVVEWTVQYRIEDPYKYLFRVRNVGETFRYMTQAVVREIVGDRTVNEALTVGRTELALMVHQKLAELCDQYQMGIKVDQIILQDITPTDPVKPSFNEVNQAQQEKEKMINQARGEYNQAVPHARGEADQTVQQAEGYAIDRINRAQGEAGRFRALYEEYRKAPEVTRRRIYVETLNQILPRVGRKIIVDKELKNIIPLLELGKEAKP